MAVKYHMQNKYQLLVFFSLLILTVLSLFLAVAISSPNNKTVFQSKAQTAGGGIDVVQQEINSAKDGATITIPAGQYTGATALPLSIGGEIAVSTARGAADTCFLRIENKKNLVVKGQGVVLFGEGHDKPDAAPYNTRAGICVINSTVMFEGLHVKEFQTRCMVVYDSTIVYKNGIIDGCDGGGASLLGNSSGLFVNNMFAELNVGGVMLWQNSQAKIVNNIFFNAAVLYFYHPGTNDQARADIINNIFSEIKSDIAQVSWWQATPEQLKMSKLSYNIIYRNKDFVCDPKFEIWCDDFPGKIVSDPLYAEPVTYPRGIAAWANFGFKEGSPAVGVGDPSIPGPKNLGNAGGPCVDPNASICSSFIQSNMPKIIEPPTPTSVPQQEVEQPPAPTLQPQKEYTASEIIPFPSPIYNNVFNQEQAILYVKNTGNNKTLKIINLYFQSTTQKLKKELTSLQSLKYSFTSFCNGSESRVKGALLYSSSEDNHQKIRYKNLDLDCYKTVIIDIE